VQQETFADALRSEAAAPFRSPVFARHVDDLGFVLLTDLVERVLRRGLSGERCDDDGFAWHRLAHQRRLVTLFEAGRTELPEPQLRELDLLGPNPDTHERMARLGHQTSIMRAER